MHRSSTLYTATWRLADSGRIQLASVGRQAKRDISTVGATKSGDSSSRPKGHNHGQAPKETRHASEHSRYLSTDAGRSAHNANLPTTRPRSPRRSMRQRRRSTPNTSSHEGTSGAVGPNETSSRPQTAGPSGSTSRRRPSYSLAGSSPLTRGGAKHGPGLSGGATRKHPLLLRREGGLGETLKPIQRQEGPQLSGPEQDAAEPWRWPHYVDEAHLGRRLARGLPAKTPGRTAGENSRPVHSGRRRQQASRSSEDSMPFDHLGTTRLTVRVLTISFCRTFTIVRVWLRNHSPSDSERL
jgi:hypothetical protein